MKNGIGPQAITVSAAQLLTTIRSSRRKKAIAASKQQKRGPTCATLHRVRKEQASQALEVSLSYPSRVISSFTLFSKCFSAFVHTTCSLSVSRQYSAFAEVHLRVYTALSNCVTLGAHEDFSWGSMDMNGTLTLCGGTSQNACSTEPQLPTGPSSTIPRFPIPSTADSELGRSFTPFTRRY
jgi:hypothetical protein